MFRKFFQTGDDDDDDGSLSHQESTLDDRGVNPQELWEEVRLAGPQGAGHKGLQGRPSGDTMEILLMRVLHPGCAQGANNRA